VDLALFFPAIPTKIIAFFAGDGEKLFRHVPDQAGSGLFTKNQ
jgi:hypothetical protein